MTDDPTPEDLEQLARAGISTRSHLSERMPAELRDREWLTANAERSHNAIALELGVSPKTVTLAMRKAFFIEVGSKRPKSGALRRHQVR